MCINGKHTKELPRMWDGENNNPVILMMNFAIRYSDHTKYKLQMNKITRITNEIGTTNNAAATTLLSKFCYKGDTNL